MTRAARPSRLPAALRRGAGKGFGCAAGAARPGGSGSAVRPPARVQPGAPRGPQPRRGPRGPRGRQSPAQGRRRLCQALPAQRASACAGQRTRSSSAAFSPCWRRAPGASGEATPACREERGGLSYADLERCALRALTREEVRNSVRGQFDYVFVDEYQDVSDLQEALIAAVSRGDDLFAVGDVKQSIYRFRLAEPRLFLGRYERYMRGEGGQLLPLTRNFRSTRPVIDFVNAVFSRTMTGGDSEIVYDELARLNAGRETGRRAHPEVHILTRRRRAADDEPLERSAARRPCEPSGSPAASASSGSKSPACATATSPSSPAPRARRRPRCCRCCSPRASPPTPRGFPAISTPLRWPSRSRFCGWWTMSLRMWR